VRDSTHGIYGRDQHGHFVDYGDKDTYAINENGVLTVTIGANSRVNKQIYSPNGWLEVVETTEGTEIHATRTVIGHRPHS
jgi:hypothetical protein